MALILEKIQHFFIKMQDIVITDILYLLPCVLKWFYHRKIKKDIFLFQLKDRFGKKASLYQHGEWESEKRGMCVTLILHGLYSHPLVMIDLAEMAQKTNLGPVFSFYVVYDEANLDFHRSLLRKAIDKIEEILGGKDCALKNVVLVGHSMGAIEAAYLAFVEKDKRISAVISIAGRLKVVESIHSPCRESLKDSLHKIYRECQSNPNISLYQIVGRHDWNASLEATLIRKNSTCYHIVEEAMHFNILFCKDMRRKFPEFLQKSLLSEKIDD